MLHVVSIFCSSHRERNHPRGRETNKTKICLAPNPLTLRNAGNNSNLSFIVLIGFVRSPEYKHSKVLMYYCFHILMLLFFFLLLCLLLCLRRRRNVSPSERNSFNALLLLLCCVYNNKIKKRTTTTTTITKLSSSLSTPLKNVHSTRKTNTRCCKRKNEEFLHQRERRSERKN